MTTDFRALCAELLDFVERLTKHYYEPAELTIRARTALAQPEPEGPTPADGEVQELVSDLRQQANYGFSEFVSRDKLLRTADLLAQRYPQPVPVSERLPMHIEQALIKAECALADIAEGEPEENEGDADALLQWAEQRAATALTRIRPVMREYGILTSEWPPPPATALPLPS